MFQIFQKLHRKHRVSAASDPATDSVMTLAASATEETLAYTLHSSPDGLNAHQVEHARETYGDNVLPTASHHSKVRRILTAFFNPFSAILFVLAIVSILTDIVFVPAAERDYMTVIVIGVMITVSGVLRYVQETKSTNAAARLARMITTTTCVRRAEQGKVEIPVDQLVVGDRVCLSAGDMIPADLRIVSAKDLFVAQSTLTGESAPEEKTAVPVSSASLHATCLAFMGTNVISGSGEGIVYATGKSTYLGKTASALTAKPEKTAFEKGVNAVSRILIAFMLVMVPIVLVVNGATKHDWLSATLFAISIAVGLTPEMLPMIVTACMAKGSVALSRQKVIVKNMNAIQNLGAADILCTDKTGTLTRDHVVLEMHLNVHGEEDDRVLRHAFLNSNYQTGLKNLLDLAIIERTQERVAIGAIEPALLDRYRKTDEIPFDFERRRMSVVVEDDSGKSQLITKGAVEEMLAICSHVELDGSVVELTDALVQRVRKQASRLHAQGMRILCVAQKLHASTAPAVTVADESDMVLIGYLAFLDPPKDSARSAIADLNRHGVAVKVLTGDNEKVAAYVCSQVGLSTDHVLIGTQIDAMDDTTLAREAHKTTVFAKLSPTQKERVVRVLRGDGHTVAFLGDGINDAPAMRAADVGICVDTAVDIAKESADVILLEKDLTVLAHGVMQGRKTYANMMKYIKITASSNFGNMFSVLVASAFLPFLPMLSIQLLLLNLVYDICCSSLPWDRVDAKLLAAPASWDSKSIAKFMFWFGPVSSIFDIATYAILYFGVCPAVCGGSYASLQDPAMMLQFATMFQTGWFLESMFTQTLILHMLRSDRMPTLRNRASAPVIALTLSGIVLLSVLPYTPIGEALQLTALPVWYFGILLAIVAAYMALSSLVKCIYRARYGSVL